MPSDVKKRHIVHFWRILMLNLKIDASPGLNVKNVGSITKFGSLVPKMASNSTPKNLFTIFTS